MQCASSIAKRIRRHTLSPSYPPVPPYILIPTVHSRAYMFLSEPQLLYILLCLFSYSLPIPAVFGTPPHIFSYIHFSLIHSPMQSPYYSCVVICHYMEVHNSSTSNLNNIRRVYTGFSTRVAAWPSATRCSCKVTPKVKAHRIVLRYLVQRN